MRYTLVQHSGYAVGGKPAFMRAVEVDTVKSEREADRILKAGGLLYDDYSAASKMEYHYNYPDPNYTGLIPNVIGNFSSMRHNGARIFVPKKGGR